MQTATMPKLRQPAPTISIHIAPRPQAGRGAVNRCNGEVATRREFVWALPAMGTAFAIGVIKYWMTVLCGPKERALLWQSTTVDFELRFEVVPGTKAVRIAQEHF